jgi:hypothetical protein
VIFQSPLTRYIDALALRELVAALAIVFAAKLVALYGAILVYFPHRSCWVVCRLRTWAVHLVRLSPNFSQGA